MQIKSQNFIFAVIINITLFVFFGFFKTAAIAQSCTGTMDNLNFGTVDLSGGSSYNTSGNLTINCSGTPGKRVRVCVSFGSGTGNIHASGDPRYMLKGAHQLDYNIYKNAAYTNVWGSYVWGLTPKGVAINKRLNGSGNFTKTRQVRAQIKAGQAGTSPGVYLSSFAGAHTSISYAYKSVGNCNVISALPGFQLPFTVMANVDGTCSVNATNLNFGTSGVLNANVDTTNNVSVQCSLGIPYTVGLSNGSSGGTGPTTRLMSAGANNVTYGIYSNVGRTIAWGDNIGVNTVAGTGSGLSQNFTGYGRVPTQTTPPPGTYTDNVIITVTY